MLLELKKISVPPGQKILLTEINWQEFEEILEELGEHRSAKIAYNNYTLEIMSPLPEHETGKILITNFIEILLEELDLEFWSMGSTTFKNQKMLKGIELDNCFYIENEAPIRGKNRIDLNIDPPPDLAIEIEVTSRTHLDIYQALGVPEIWQFSQETLQINLLQERQYIPSQTSKIFPDLNLVKIIPEYLKKCKIEGRNKTMKAWDA